MRTVRPGPAIGLAAQAALVLALARTVGLGAAGWLAGVGYGLVLCATLNRALNRALGRSGTGRLGPADRVTLTRAVLAGGVTAMVAGSAAGPGRAPVLLALAVLALVLDAVDGCVARRTGTSSALGARFDMEVDAFLILVLSGYASRSVGGWVLAIGVMRYAYLGASWVVPWLRRPVPPRYWRKVVAATQGVVLVVAAAGVLPRSLVSATIAVALGLLVESFGRDVGWQWRHRPAPPLPAAPPAGTATLVGAGSGRSAPE